MVADLGAVTVDPRSSAQVLTISVIEVGVNRGIGKVVFIELESWPDWE